MAQAPFSGQAEFTLINSNLMLDTLFDLLKSSLFGIFFGDLKSKYKKKERGTKGGYNYQ